jgi:CRP-like cAMP-binding protein
MFSNCSLLNHLNKYQLEFIVNNAKPVHFPISKEIAIEGETPKALYLIISGNVELRQQQQKGAG